MNPIFEQIKNHRSIRKYKSDPIPQDMMDRILSAALRTSSSGNMQVYSVIVTTDPSIKKELLPAHFDQPMVTEAPAFITFCADFHRMRRWLELREAPENFDNFMSFMIATIDATLAAQTAAMAAEAEGLGICFLGTTLASCDQIARILKCPSHVVPVVGFSVGFPDEKPAPRDRLPLNGIVHHETYQESSDDNIINIYKEREQQGWKRYLEVPELRQRIQQTDVKNLAQIYTKLKYTRESHIKYSQTVMNCLIEKGFIRDQSPLTETTKF